MDEPGERAVVTRNVVSMLAEAAPGAEVVSQALFGEVVAAIARWGEWSRIATPDGYEGWAPSSALWPLPEHATYPEPAGTVSVLFAPISVEPHPAAPQCTLLTLGSPVELAPPCPDTGYRGIRMPDGTIAYARAGDVTEAASGRTDDLGEAVVAHARRYVGVPYLWGGRSPFGIDCSGFSQAAYRLCGVTLPRDAYLQALSPLVAEVDAAALEPGDLVFFRGDRDPRRRGITHVGIATDDGRFIHAQGGVGVNEMPLATPPFDRQLVKACRLAEPR